MIIKKIKNSKNILLALYIISFITSILNLGSSFWVISNNNIPNLTCIALPFSFSFFSLTSLYIFIYKQFWILILEIIIIILLVIGIQNLIEFKKNNIVHYSLAFLYLVDFIQIVEVLFYFDIQYISHIMLYMICGFTDIIIILIIIIYLLRNKKVKHIK